MIHYPKIIQIILNLTEIEALPKYIRNKSSEIQNLFSAKIQALVMYDLIIIIIIIIKCKIEVIRVELRISNRMNIIILLYVL